MHSETMTFRAGDPVKISPATDTWMRGERYGRVTKIGRKYVHVRLIPTGRIGRFLPEDLEYDI